MPVDREALKKSLYDNDSADPHTQLLMKGTLSLIETMECLPCEKHEKDISSIKSTIKYWAGAIGALVFVIGLILTLLKIFG